MDSNQISYNEAIKKIETLLAELERGDADIETLSERLAQATSYIKLCQEKLSRATGQVEELFKMEDGQ